MTDTIAQLLAGHVHPDEVARLADQIRAAVLTEAVRSLRVYAARERAAQPDPNHEFWDGVGHAARLITRAANDIEENQ